MRILHGDFRLKTPTVKGHYEISEDPVNVSPFGKCQCALPTPSPTPLSHLAIHKQVINGLITYTTLFIPIKSSDTERERESLPFASMKYIVL